MKTSKKTTVCYVASLLATCLLAVGCGSDDLVDLPQTSREQLPVVHFSAEVTGEGSGSGVQKAKGPKKIAISESADLTLVTNWEAGDRVAIIYTNTDNTKAIAELTVTSVGTSGNAYLDGTLTGPKDGTDVKMVYPYDAADVSTTSGIKADYLKTGQDGTLATIADKYAVNAADARLSVEGATATLQGLAHFSNKTAICKFTFKENGTTLTGINYLSIGDMIIHGSNLSSVFVAFDPTVSGEKRFTVLNRTTNSYSGTATPSLTAGTFYRPTINMTSSPLYVDLGLPSGTKWATCNIGATSPEGSGDWFAWGATEPYYEKLNADNSVATWKTGKTGYNWASYFDTNDGGSSFIKYNNSGTAGTYKKLQSEDDAATANWGSDWCIPTQTQLQELADNCYWEWTADYNGTSVAGYIVYKVKDDADADKGQKSYEYTPNVAYSIINDTHIFLPAVGFFSDTILNWTERGNYWASELYSSDVTKAWRVAFRIDNVGVGNNTRYNGRSVRAVLAQ